MNTNIIFFGTPDFAKNFLASLNEDEDLFVSAVVAQPDKPVGRKKKLTPPPTKMYANKHDIPVLQPTTLKNNTEFKNELQKYEPDLFVVVAYGRIIPDDTLDIPRLGAINVHPSLLPKYRGPSPIQSAIAAGEKESGVTIMLIDEEMDHGPVLAQKKISMTDNETPESFRSKSISIGVPLLLKTVKKYVAGNLKPVPQDHDRATYCSLLSRENGKVNWTEPAQVIERKMRAYTPWPGTWTTLNGDRVKIHKARVVKPKKDVQPGELFESNGKLMAGAGSRALEIIEIQPAGKQKMQAKAFINGSPDVIGRVLGSE